MIEVTYRYRRSDQAALLSVLKRPERRKRQRTYLFFLAVMVILVVANAPTRDAFLELWWWSWLGLLFIPLPTLFFSFSPSISGPTKALKKRSWVEEDICITLAGPFIRVRTEDFKKGNCNPVDVRWRIDRKQTRYFPCAWPERYADFAAKRLCKQRRLQGRSRHDH